MTGPPSSYRFADVIVDPERGTVSVSGEPVECQPLAFRLLLVLCEARGAVIARERLMEILWPGQIVVSDESLTQVLHRLRAALGAAGQLVRTVRGLGVRIAADVDSAPLLARATAEQVRSAEATPRRGRRWLLAVVAAVALTAAATAALQWRRGESLDSGYALLRADLGADQAGTAGLVEAAFLAEGGGDRGRALTLLRTAHESDDRTPIPAVFLAIWGGGGEADERLAWGERARARLAADASPYQRLLVDYALLSLDGGSLDSLAAASSILELRPGAWKLRLARAHYHLSRGYRQSALADLQQIPLHAVGGRAMAVVLADRAALGDLANAEADLRRVDLGGEALRLFTEARFEWSRGRPAAAVAALDRAQAEAIHVDQVDFAGECRGLAALLAAEAGAADARARMDQARIHFQASGRATSRFEATALSAYLAARDGDVIERDRRLSEAANLAADAPHLRVALALMAETLAQDPAEDLGGLAERLAPIPEFLGVRELLLARAAYRRGEREVSMRLLTDARARGISSSFYAEDALLLGANLGEAAVRCKVDPPYPNALRFVACWELAKRFLGHAGEADNR